MIHTLLSTKLGLLMVTSLALAGQPSTKERSAQPSESQPTLRSLPARGQLGSASAFLRAPIMPERGAAVRPQVTASLVLRPTGSFGVLTNAEVSVFRSGELLATGSAHSVIEVPVGAPVDVRVRVMSLLDQPTHTLRALSLSAGEQPTGALPVELETGLVRVEARDGSRRIAGRAVFHRIGADGRPAASPSAGIGATGESAEISAGYYEVRLAYRGELLVARVDIAPGSTRLVRLNRG